MGTLLSRLALMLTALVLGFDASHAVWAQGTLENPAPGSFHSGIGHVTGWKCAAGTLTYNIDGGSSAPLSYGTSRADTQGICGEVNNGFIAEINWNLAGDGVHTIHVFDDGVEFASAVFLVSTFGVEYLEGASGIYILQNFPEPGQDTTIRWDESEQNFEIIHTPASGTSSTSSSSSSGGTSSSSGGTSSSSSTSSTSSGGTSSSSSSGGTSSSSSSGSGGSSSSSSGGGS